MKNNFCGLGKGLIALLTIMGVSQAGNAQVSVGTDTPDPSAQFQIESTNKGLLIPRVASTGNVTAPATGLMVYQTGGTPGFYYNSGTAIAPSWVRVATGSVEVADSTITNAKVAPGAAIAYSKLALSNSIQNGDIVVNAITTSKVANGTVTTSKMADSAISGLKLLTNAVSSRHIADYAVSLSKIDPAGATSGQVPTYNGTSITWATPSGGSSSSAYGFVSNTGSPTIAVVLGGTNIPLPNNQNLASGITVDGSNTTLTVSDAGTYKIDYNVNLTAAMLASSRILINGTQLSPSVISPSIAREIFTSSSIVTLSAGSTINLQLFGLLGAVTLSSGGGATLSVQKL